MGAVNPQSRVYRPTDLARLHGLSAQAVRNYEQQGVLPPATRTPTGYRQYREEHRTALGAYLALIGALGHPAAGEIMRALHRGDLDAALEVIAEGHAQLQRDRGTLRAVEAAAGQLTGPVTTPGGPLPIGALAHRLKVRPATLRKWERAGILTPGRDRAGYRVYAPADVRDADLTHLLRRGGYPLAHIASVVRQVRGSFETAALSDSLAAWQARLTARGRALLTAAARIEDFLSSPR